MFLFGSPYEFLLARKTKISKMKNLIIWKIFFIKFCRICFVSNLSKPDKNERQRKNSSAEDIEINFNQRLISIGWFLSRYSKQVSPVMPPNPFAKFQKLGDSFVEKNRAPITRVTGKNIMRLKRKLTLLFTKIL